MQLTDTSVRAPKAPEAGVKVYAHDTRAGFGVRVSQAGAKSFVLSTGKTRGHVTIGRYPIMAMAEARKIAGLITAERAVGRHQMPRIAFGAALNLYEGSNTSPSSPRDPKKAIGRLSPSAVDTSARTSSRTSPPTTSRTSPTRSRRRAE